MSGSPIYMDDRLIGAVAYAWAYGKDPIAGVTPFSQMQSFSDSFERTRLADAGRPTRVGLSSPVRAGGRSFDSVSVSQRYDAPKGDDDGLFMVPLRAPLACSGFSANSLRMLHEQYPELGLTPVQGGTAGAATLEEAKNARIEPGAALSVALIDGDFDMSGIGTVTHVDGKRVYGWGHPFMSLGGCELPLMTGWVHTVYPRQTVSFKMGSPLKAVGTITADVSTGIAGWLDREPDMLPVTMKVRKEPGGTSQVFKVRVARQKQLMSGLVYAALTNSIDMEGDLPEEMTASFTCRIEIEGKEPIVIKDAFAGSNFSGTRAPGSLYGPVASIVSQLLNHPFKPVRITRIECETEVRPGRDAADVEGVELAADTYAPGDTLRATVFLRPYRGKITRMPLTLKIPSDLPDGSYTLQITDEASSARLDLRGRTDLTGTQSEDGLLEALRMLAAGKRTTLVARLALPAGGVAIDGKALADLPPSVVQILGQTRRVPVAPMTNAVVGREPTPWTIFGGEAVRFTVSRAKRTSLTANE
jgi:hypothetical protein